MPPAEGASALTHYDIHVLLVDDQPMVGEMVKRMLGGEEGIRFHYCQDPANAIQTALEFSPTVILQDLVMPDVDGLTLVKWFRAHPKLKDIPLIVLSSREEAVTKAEAFALGANDYLVKLPDRIELVARIRYHSGGYIASLQRNEAYEALLASQQALAAELARAAEYVTSLLPKPVASGAVLTDWRYIPSAQLGGDSFGYHWTDPEHFTMYLLDVSGHGVGSALLSVSALDAIRSQALPHVDFRAPEGVLAGMNEAFQMRHHNNLFFTAWYGVYDAGARTLRYASGGHPPALLVSARGEVERLSTPNPIIGAFPNTPFRGSCALIEPGSRLYIFSDGVYEVDAPDGSMWEFDNLQEFLLGCRGTASEIDTLYAFLQQMHGADVLEDDFSMLRVEFP